MATAGHLRWRPLMIRCEHFQHLCVLANNKGLKIRQPMRLASSWRSATLSPLGSHSHGNASHVQRNMRLSIPNGNKHINKCLRCSQAGFFFFHFFFYFGGENRSQLLNVDSATLPPSGAKTQCMREAFSLSSPPGCWLASAEEWDIDRPDTWSLASVFCRHLGGLLKIFPRTWSWLQAWQ